MSNIPHFILEPGCEDQSFLEQAVADIGHGLDSILTDPVNPPEPKVLFDEADAVPSSVSSGFLCLVSTHSDNSRLQLASSVKCIHYSARLGYHFYLYHRWVKCQPVS